MKKKYLYTLAAFGFISLLFVGVCIGAEYKKTTPDLLSLWQDMSLGVLCSVVASIIFCMLQAFASTDDHKEEMETLSQINEKLKIKNGLYDSGIVSIRKKSYYDRDGKFWKDIIELTTGRLDLIGHSISKWFREEYKTIFVQKIIGMLREGKNVRIILSGDQPDMDKVHKAESEGVERCKLTKIERTCYELRKIVKTVPNGKKDKLEVYIAEPSKITYMYIRTDHQCFISPYITSATNDANSFLLELETKVEYSKCFDDDFTELLQCSLYQVKLEG